MSTDNQSSLDAVLEGDEAEDDSGYTAPPDSRLPTRPTKAEGPVRDGKTDYFSTDKLARFDKGNRRDFELYDMDSLINSFKASGQLQAGVIRPHSDPEKSRDGWYEIIAGYRRYLACRELGTKFFATVRYLDDKHAKLAQIAENEQQGGLSPWARSINIVELIEDYGLSVRDACDFLNEQNPNGVIGKNEINRMQHTAQIPVEVVQNLSDARKLTLTHYDEIYKFMKDNNWDEVVEHVAAHINGIIEHRLRASDIKQYLKNPQAFLGTKENQAASSESKNYLKKLTTKSGRTWGSYRQVGASRGVVLSSECLDLLDKDKSKEERFIEHINQFWEQEDIAQALNEVEDD